MRKLLILVFVLMCLSACARKGNAPAEGVAMRVDAGAKHGNIAYTHNVHISVPVGEIAGTLKAIQLACDAEGAQACVVLESELSSGRYPAASMKLRAAAQGIQMLMDLARSRGEVVSQSTHAEDLAAPIEDGARKLAMLGDYRSKLQALLAKPNNDADALIKLTRELSQVQGELEAAAGEQAHLKQRVETQVLTLQIDSSTQATFWGPVGAALRDFGTHLSDGIASTVTGLAYLLPWLVVLGVAGWAGRRLWRWRKRA